MADSIKVFWRKILTTASGQTCIVALSILVVAFILCFIFILACADYGIKRRSWFFLSSVGLGLLQTGVGMIFGATGYGFIVLGLGCVLSAVIVSLPVKKCSASEGQKAFVKFLKDKIGRENNGAGQNATGCGDQTIDGRRSVEPVKSTALSISQPSKQSEVNEINRSGKDKSVSRDEKNYDMNFAHVKNIIARLEYFNLTPTDLRQVKELEINLLAVERGERDEGLRQKINSGLSALLKIMSKYGV